MLSDMNRVIMHYSFKKTVYVDGDGRKNSYPSVVIENSEKYEFRKKLKQMKILKNNSILEIKITI